jgi:transformation/transcription domain-associated protein
LALFEEICDNHVPQNMLSTYFGRSAQSPVDLWTLRKQMAAQMAMTAFLTYVMNIGHRLPHKVLISKATGNIWCTELLPRTFCIDEWL